MGSWVVWCWSFALVENLFICNCLRSEELGFVSTYGLLGDDVGRRSELHGLLLGWGVDLRHIEVVGF